MRVVEMVGLPGSGKTTVLPHVKHILQELGKRVYTAKEARVLCIRKKHPSSFMRMLFSLLPKKLLIRYPVLYNHALESLLQNVQRVQLPTYQKYMELVIRKVGDNKQNGWIIDQCMQLIGEHHILSEILEVDAVVLRDEGFYQKLLSVFSEDEKVNKEEVQQYLASVPTPDVLVVPECPPKVCLKRALERKKPHERLSARTDAQQKAFMAANSQALLGILALHSDAIRIATDNAPADAKTQIFAQKSAFMQLLS